MRGAAAVEEAGGCGGCGGGSRAVGCVTIDNNSASKIGPAVTVDITSNAPPTGGGFDSPAGDFFFVFFWQQALERELAKTDEML